MIVGVDLLKLGPITFNFEEPNIQFKKGNKHLILQGITQEVSLQMISGNSSREPLEKERVHVCV